MPGNRRIKANNHELKTSHFHNAMVEWRYNFHVHPELGFEGHITATKFAELLDNFGFQVHQGIGGTGVVGILEKGGRTRSIGLRADIDALPIEEDGPCAYSSQQDGVMHACGHDGHTTML